MKKIKGNEKTVKNNMKYDLVNLLDEILAEGKYSNIQLNHYFSTRNYTRKERMFVTNVINIVLKNLIYIDYLLEKTTRNIQKRKIKQLLRISVAQLFFMESDNAGVLFEAGEIAKKINSEGLKERIEVPKREDELQNLTLIINEMLDRLEFSFENQTKFVSDASHELRTPLAIIKGYAEIIKKRRLTNEEIFEESIDSIINETDNMRNLVQKLLFLAKGEITKINTNFVKIDINEMVTQIYSDTVISMTTHQFHLEKGEDFSIQGDETLLQQAIRALIENAVKYSEKGTNVYIKSELRDGIGRISVRDEGVGISEEDAKRVFDRFYRVDLSRTKATGGTGLGLAIVKRIVEIHDGKIEVESKVGKGTEIIIVLPLEGKKVEEVKEEKPQKPQKQHFIKVIEKFRK